MILFHASREELTEGAEIISAASSCSYELASIEIDKNRPDTATARKEALYSADTPEFAFYFMMMQKVSADDIKLYRVEAKVIWKAVFSITSAVNKRLQNGKAIESLVDEYWNPTKNWNFYEYLSPSFTVIEKIKNPKHKEYIMQDKYNRDYDLASSIS